MKFFFMKKYSAEYLTITKFSIKKTIDNRRFLYENIIFISIYQAQDLSTKKNFVMTRNFYKKKLKFAPKKKNIFPKQFNDNLQCSFNIYGHQNYFK